MEKTLIIGVSGQIGSHLNEVLPVNSVIGICRTPRCENQITCNIEDYEAVVKIIKLHKPKKIFHLAAYHFRLNECFNIADMYQANVVGTIHLLEALTQVRMNDSSYDPIIIVTSTQMVYAQGEKPYSEESPIAPSSLYALSKCQQEDAIKYYHQRYGLNTIVARLSAVTGPRADHGSVYDFCRKAVMIECGALPMKLTVGDLNVYRSITHACDVADALIMLSDSDAYGEVFNVCGEQYYKVADVLEIVRSKCKIHFDVEVRADLFPVSDMFQVGNSEKLRRTIDWIPKYSLEETIDEMLNYYREYSKNIQGAIL